jgi:hypothetical protein
MHEMQCTHLLPLFCGLNSHFSVRIFSVTARDTLSSGQCAREGHAIFGMQEEPGIFALRVK